MKIDLGVFFLRLMNMKLTSNLSYPGDIFVQCVSLLKKSDHWYLSYNQIIQIVILYFGNNNR